MDKSTGLVIKFRVQISQRSVVVLGKAFNLKMPLCYVRKPGSVASIVRLQSPRKRKNRYRLLAREVNGSKDGEFKMQEKQFKVDMLKIK